MQKSRVTHHGVYESMARGYHEYKELMVDLGISLKNRRAEVTPCSEARCPI